MKKQITRYRRTLGNSTRKGRKRASLLFYTPMYSKNDKEGMATEEKGCLCEKENSVAEVPENIWRRRDFSLQLPCMFLLTNDIKKPYDSLFLSKMYDPRALSPSCILCNLLLALWKTSLIYSLLRKKFQFSVILHGFFLQETNKQT